MATTHKLILATHPLLQLKSFLTSSSEPLHWKVLAIRCRASVFIMKQKSPAPSRSSLPALPLLGPDSLALDCVLRARFLLLEVRTGTGVRCLCKLHCRCCLLFHEAFASISSSFSACFCTRSAILKKKNQCAY